LTILLWLSSQYTAAASLIRRRRVVQVGLGSDSLHFNARLMIARIQAVLPDISRHSPDDVQLMENLRQLCVSDKPQALA
jgi:hypothetical protein